MTTMSKDDVHHCQSAHGSRTDICSTSSASKGLGWTRGDPNPLCQWASARCVQRRAVTAPAREPHAHYSRPLTLWCVS